MHGTLLTRSLRPCAPLRRTMFTFVIFFFAAFAAVTAIARPRRAAAERREATEVYGAARFLLISRGIAKPTHEQVLKEASKIAKDMLSDPHMKNQLRFIRRWGGAAELGDAPRAGRAPWLGDDECKEIITFIRKGTYNPDGTHRPYTDIQEVCERNPFINAMRLHAGYATPRSFFKRLRRVDPGLRRRKVVLKPYLEPHTKEERVEDCKWYLGIRKTQPHYLHRLFFLDAKTLYCSPVGGYAIVHEKDMEQKYQTDKQLKKSFKNAKKIKFYCCVNWHVGVVGFWVCQGTTSWPLVYRVRTPTRPRAQPASLRHAH